MAGRTAVGSVVVLLSDDICHLPSLRARPYRMAIAAADAGVIAVSKDGAKDVSRLRSAAVRSKLVTDVARADLALRRVARKAVIVGLDPGGDRFAGPCRSMAMRAAGGRAALAIVVGSMVKLHVKALAKPHRK